MQLMRQAGDVFVEWDTHWSTLRLQLKELRKEEARRICSHKIPWIAFHYKSA